MGDCVDQTLIWFRPLSENQLSPRLILEQKQEQGGVVQGML